MVVRGKKLRGLKWEHLLDLSNMGSGRRARARSTSSLSQFFYSKATEVFAANVASLLR